MKLTEDQKDLLRQVVDGDGYKVVLQVLNAMQQEQLDQILKLPLPATTDRDLLIAKARAEGSAKIIKDLELFLARFKKQG